MTLRLITKNHAADPKIGFLTKSISKPYGRANGHVASVGVNLKFILVERLQYRMVLWIIESRKVEVGEVIDRAKTYEMRKQDRPFMKIVLGPE